MTHLHSILDLAELKRSKGMGERFVDFELMRWEALVPMSL